MCYSLGMNTTENSADTARCTVGPDATSGQRCGEPAVTSFVGSDGEIYHECAKHAVKITPSGRVGDPVEVRRYGHSYIGRIHHITRAGRIYAEWTYANGHSRVGPVASN